MYSEEPHQVGTRPDAGREQETAHGERHFYSALSKTHSQVPPQKVLMQSMGWGEDPARSSVGSQVRASPLNRGLGSAEEITK